MGIIKDPTSWRTGFELGLAGFSFPYSKPRNPTAYLYNGVRLPALPEWDREEYPYAVITRTGLVGNYYYALKLFASPYKTTGNNALTSAFNMSPDVGAKHLSCSCPYTDAGDGTFVWSEVSENEITEETHVLVGKPIWGNYDLETNGGTLWLATSEPIPIYE